MLARVKANVRRKTMSHYADLFVRVVCACILLFFAFAPAWVLFHSLVQVILDPTAISWTAVLVITVSFALLCFLLMLVWRAITGIGRAKDGELLPFWLSKLFVAAFGVMGVCITIFGFSQLAIPPVFGGILYTAVAGSLYRSISNREQMEKLDA